METIDTTRDVAHHQRTGSGRSRAYPWFRKSKSEADKESLHGRGHLMSSGGATTSSHTSTSSTAASGALHHRTDTMSSSSSHDMSSARMTSSMPVLVKHAAVQCQLLTGGGAGDSTPPGGCDATTSSTSGDHVSSGMCADMAAMYRGTSHQRRKAIAATDDESLLSQHPINRR